MALEVAWTDEADKDPDETIAYIGAKWTEKEIRRFFHRLEVCLNKIVEAPQRQKDSLRKAGTKEFQHTPQTTILYSYDDKLVDILRLCLCSNFKEPGSL